MTRHRPHSMQRLLCAAALGAALLPAGCAYAQWQASIATGIRLARTTETDAQGRQLVREQGWLPGLELRAEYLLPDWRVGVAGATYRERIAYDGQLQNGTPFSTDTRTAQHRIGLEVERRLSASWQAVGGIEWERWQRAILGRNAVLGLDERYDTWRLLVGAAARLPPWPAAQARLKALLVIARPEQLQVRFDDQLYDDANFRTKPTLGGRLALDVRPAALPNLSLGADLEWQRIARSDDAVLRKNGAAVGLVAQPEHQRRALGLHIRYLFE